MSVKEISSEIIKTGKVDFNTSSIKDSSISVNKICYITTSDDLDIVMYLSHGMLYNN
jgi:hypothetical protein